jgi:hypothetical protein
VIKGVGEMRKMRKIKEIFSSTKVLNSCLETSLQKRTRCR